MSDRQAEKIARLQASNKELDNINEQIHAMNVPRTEPVKRADGSVGWVVVHRDAIERAVVLSIEEWERKYYPTKDGDA